MSKQQIRDFDKRLGAGEDGVLTDTAAWTSRGSGSLQRGCEHDLALQTPRKAREAQSALESRGNHGAGTRRIDRLWVPLTGAGRTRGCDDSFGLPSEACLHGHHNSNLSSQPRVLILLGLEGEGGKSKMGDKREPQVLIYQGRNCNRYFPNRQIRQQRDPRIV